MGGKGIRRREKNYRAAHGNGDRLPPPPDLSSVDAVPSKLRKIMSFAGAGRQFVKGNGIEKEALSGKASEAVAAGTKRKISDQSFAASSKHGNEVPHIGGQENRKKKKKRKGKKADDLRFETAVEHGGAGSQRKGRKKQRLVARKKKHKSQSTEEDLDFPGQEDIKFGDVVEAPPKLLSVPKAFKSIQDASQERLRIQAVEAYRKRKGWASRPGVQLPSPVTTL